MQAVRSVASSGKFYWLLPDKESTGNHWEEGHFYIDQYILSFKIECMPNSKNVCFGIVFLHVILTKRKQLWHREKHKQLDWLPKHNGSVWVFFKFCYVLSSSPWLMAWLVPSVTTFPHICWSFIRLCVPMAGHLSLKIYLGSEN